MQAASQVIALLMQLHGFVACVRRAAITWSAARSNLWLAAGIWGRNHCFKCDARYMRSVSGRNDLLVSGVVVLNTAAHRLISTSFRRRCHYRKCGLSSQKPPTKAGGRSGRAPTSVEEHRHKKRRAMPGQGIPSEYVSRGRISVVASLSLTRSFSFIVLSS